MNVVYFDVFTFNDYDRLVRYLLKNQCPMANRNKLAMSLAAKVPEGLPERMLQDVAFEDTIICGEKPLFEDNAVTEGTEWSNPEPQFAE